VQTIRWADEATTDLVEIIDYIEQRNDPAAQNLYATIVNLPKICRSCRICSGPVAWLAPVSWLCILITLWCIRSAPM
jgi:hypothetical protein